MKQVYRYQIVRGDSDSQTLIHKVNGVEVPLVTGDTVYFTVKKNYYTEDKIFQKVITVFDAGRATLNTDPTDTSDLEFGEYVFDIQISYANGEVKTPIVGVYEVLEEATYE